MTDTFQPLGALAAAVVEKCAQRAEFQRELTHRHAVAAVRAQRDISRTIEKLIDARGHAGAAQYLREKLQQIEARS